MNNFQEKLLNKCLALRYCYYVENISIISDYDYDVLEKKCQAFAPEDSIIHRPGSSLSCDYPIEVIEIAKSLIENYEKE